MSQTHDAAMILLRLQGIDILQLPPSTSYIRDSSPVIPHRRDLHPDVPQKDQDQNLITPAIIISFLLSVIIGW